jgi:S-(hydroxymethyl)glutathione dehydrogenase/alcohol dehydrogenase
VRAAVCHAFGQPLVVEEVELERPRAGEIAVRLAACAVCHSDVASIEGAWGGRLPAVFGHEASGVVEEVGEDVDAVARGDRVVVTLVRACGRCALCVRGEPALCEATFPLDRRSPLRSRDGREIRQGIRVAAFAERAVVHESQAVPMPPDLSLEVASLLGCGVVTGFGAVVNTTQVEAGNSVVVIGAGGVGLNVLQAAALVEADPVVAVDVAAAKLAVAGSFGATHVVDSTYEDVRTTVLELTAGHGADYVFVAVGAGGAAELGLTLLRRGGTLGVLGMPASGVTVAFDPTAIAHDGQRIVGSKLGSTRPHVDIPRLADLYRQGRLKLDELVSARYPLDEINAALESAASGTALRNVVVLGDTA